MIYFVILRPRRWHPLILPIKRYSMVNRTGNIVFIEFCDKCYEGYNIFLRHTPIECDGIGKTAARVFH